MNVPLLSQNPEIERDKNAILFRPEFWFRWNRRPNSVDVAYKIVIMATAEAYERTQR